MKNNSLQCSDSSTKSADNMVPNFPCTLDTTPMAPPPPAIIWAAMDCDNATGP